MTTAERNDRIASLRGQGLTYDQIGRDASIMLTATRVRDIILQREIRRTRSKRPDRVAVLSARARHCLRDAGFTDYSTARQVAKAWPILVTGAINIDPTKGSIKNFGRGTLKEVAEWLARNRIAVDYRDRRPAHQCREDMRGPWSHCPYCGSEL